MTDQPLNHVRHDTADLFRMPLGHPPWMMTPCIVQVDGEWKSIRHPDLLLHLPDDTEVLCPWPGKARTDVFRFTVGEFRAAAEFEATLEREAAFTFAKPTLGDGEVSVLVTCQMRNITVEAIATSALSDGIGVREAEILAEAKGKQRAIRELRLQLAKVEAAAEGGGA
jgi:hypothetical protein